MRDRDLRAEGCTASSKNESPESEARAIIFTMLGIYRNHQPAAERWLNEEELHRRAEANARKLRFPTVRRVDQRKKVAR